MVFEVLALIEGEPLESATFRLLLNSFGLDTAELMSLLETNTSGSLLRRKRFFLTFTGIANGF